MEGEGWGGGKDLRKERDLKRDWEGTQETERQEVGASGGTFPKAHIGRVPPPKTITTPPLPLPLL